MERVILCIDCEVGDEEFKVCFKREEGVEGVGVEDVVWWGVVEEWCDFWFEVGWVGEEFGFEVRGWYSGCGGEGGEDVGIIIIDGEKVVYGMI